MIAARFHDGLVARTYDVGLAYEVVDGTGTLVIRRADDRSELARWAAGALYALHGRNGELRLACLGQVSGARIVVRGGEDVARVLATIPILTERRWRETGRQLRLALTATLALFAIIAAYLYGVPLLAGRIVALVPPAWETQLGETVAGQIAASMGEDGALALCDPDPQSPANRAIARFGAAALAGSGSPFDLDIRVVQSSVPNAFALPGGQVFFSSALLDLARSQDEFAGVLAHEIGHVAHRHGMEQLISTAGTGILIGFILGDMTGISVAAGLGATMIDARFSRAAEQQADLFAAQLAHRFDFNPADLADLIGRIREDDAYSRALALLSTHPLTEDRKAALEILAQRRPLGLDPPFSASEWAAIRAMCGAPEWRQSPIPDAS
jgi:Zn-dependent protease with chaperone function